MDRINQKFLSSLPVLLQTNFFYGSGPCCSSLQATEVLPWHKEGDRNECPEAGQDSSHFSSSIINARLKNYFYSKTKAYEPG